MTEMNKELRYPADAAEEEKTLELSDEDLGTVSGGMRRMSQYRKKGTDSKETDSTEPAYEGVTIEF